MRFLLILLAVLSGLSLSDVPAVAQPAEVVGLASGVAVSATSQTAVCAVRARMVRHTIRLDRARALAAPAAVFAQPCGITIADRPLE